MSSRFVEILIFHFWLPQFYPELGRLQALHFLQKKSTQCNELFLQTDMENIEDRFRKASMTASMTGSIHELQDDSVVGLMPEPPILEDLKREDEEDEIFEDAQDEFAVTPVDVLPSIPQPDQQVNTKLHCDLFEHLSLQLGT
jgi:hypothetical protein